MKTIKTKPQGVFLQTTLTGRTPGWDGWMTERMDRCFWLYIAWLIAKNAMPATNKQVTEPINKTKF